MGRKKLENFFGCFDLVKMGKINMETGSPVTALRK
jgi:hypothetical protein